MKGRDGKGAASTDFLVCFPTRAHLTLMPKPMCSPARHHKKPGARPGVASPHLWARNSKQMGPESSSEPTSPKVTCAGQIKVRPARSAAACRNWQSVMEEIERIHAHEKQRKKSRRPTWADALGFKKEVMQFLTCLRSIKFDFRCFGSFPEQGITSDDDEDDDDEEHQEDAAEIEEDSRTVFSKWFMVLQENQEDELIRKQGDNDDDDDDDAEAVPPPNALLLMRCRSAPAQSRARQGGDGEHQMKKKKKKRESLEMVMKYDTDFNSEVAEETWVVGGLGDPFSRSRSWKR